MSGDGTANLQMVEDMFHHIQPFQVAVLGGELLELLFVKQAPEQVLLPGCRSGLRPEILKYIVETKHGDFSSRLAADSSGRR
ncbi:hypothetical protein EDP2_3942 [Enterobacter cloacae S611]|uniref:Uncharacterized protein n=1 Tax=Enterobacter cloacae S611 TaxID=1399146 RepID=A0ABP2ZTS6_ENTCL|nr:hypothetical protein EDP2_3942 [Enterobacter cloacae S611]